MKLQDVSMNANAPSSDLQFDMLGFLVQLLAIVRPLCLELNT